MSLQDAIPRCDGSYYAAKQIEFEYPMDLWLILENKYAEKAYLDDVHIVVNMIFQDIADELKEGLLSYLPYSIVFCAKLRGELHCGLGPHGMRKNSVRFFWNQDMKRRWQAYEMRKMLICL